MHSVHNLMFMTRDRFLMLDRSIEDKRLLFNIYIDDCLLVLLGLLSTSCGTPFYNRHTLPKNHFPLTLLPFPDLFDVVLVSHQGKPYS